MMPIINDVMVDQFGNYLCQKIIEVADPQSLATIVDQLVSQLVDISLNVHGTRAV